MNSTFKNRLEKYDRLLWTEILDHDELIYKLTLKFLRTEEYDTGNNVIPKVKNLFCRIYFTTTI